jgi:hypothetical protein
MTETKQLEEIRKITLKFANYFGYGMNKELSDKMLAETEEKLLALLKEEKLKLLGEVEMKQKDWLFLARNPDTGKLIGLFEKRSEIPVICDGASCEEAYNACIDDLNTKLSLLRKKIEGSKNG